MKRRLDRLEKLSRLREIARVQAMRDAAEALDSFRRAQHVAERSAALRAELHAAGDGKALHDRFRFAAALGDLRAEAERDVQRADAHLSGAQIALDHRTRERDLVTEKRDAIRSAMRRVQPEPSPALARSLNSSEAKRSTPRAPERTA